MNCILHIMQLLNSVLYNTLTHFFTRLFRFLVRTAAVLASASYAGERLIGSKILQIKFVL